MMAIAALILAAGGWLGGSAGDAGAASIPPLRGTTFSGETVALPDALRGRVGVLIVGFSEASRKEAADWGHKLADDPQRPAEIAYYEMPVLESVPKLLRGWVLKKIKESVSAKGQAHFLPVLDHEADWKRAAGYGKADDAYLLVVDGNGVVRWKTEGALSDSAYAEVKRQAAQLKP
jgi:hypothetical protein